MVDNYQQKIVALNAVTATTTSEVIPCKGARKITMLLTRAAHGSGSSAFSVTGSVDDTTYVACNTIIDNLTNAITEGLTRITTKTLSSNTSALVALDLCNFGYSSLKVTCTETTDGTHSATVFIEY